MRYSSNLAVLPQNLIRISQESAKLFKMHVKSGKHFYFTPYDDKSVPTPFESDEYLTDSKWLFQKMVEFMYRYDMNMYIKHFENVPEYKPRGMRDSGSGPSQLFSLVENVVYLRT